MNENQLRLVFEALRLLQRRSVGPNRTREQRLSYGSAHDILWYVLCENEECLAQYDDVKLHCDECARIESDDASDIQLCNACENHEFFCCGRSNVR
jgi:hypothetical protein